VYSIFIRLHFYEDSHSTQLYGSTSLRTSAIIMVYSHTSNMRNERLFHVAPFKTPSIHPILWIRLPKLYMPSVKSILKTLIKHVFAIQIENVLMKRLKCASMLNYTNEKNNISRSCILQNT
jgi:hypothetical protein